MTAAALLHKLLLAEAVVHLSVPGLCTRQSTSLACWQMLLSAS